MEELIEALETIKEECERHDRCLQGCPFLNEHGQCGIIAKSPCNWEIVDNRPISLLRPKKERD